MLYLLAIVCPPAAALAAGGPRRAAANAGLTLLLYVPGLIHALAQPRHADELSRELGLPAGELAVVLMRLEMRKAVRRLPGNQYERR